MQILLKYNFPCPKRRFLSFQRDSFLSLNPTKQIIFKFRIDLNTCVCMCVCVCVCVYVCTRVPVRVRTVYSIQNLYKISQILTRNGLKSLCFKIYLTLAKVT